MRRLTRLETASLLVAALLPPLACAPVQTPPPVPLARDKGLLTGNVTYMERVALPPNATVRVQVWDGVLPPAEATVGETSFLATGQVPLPFTLFFDAGLLQSSHPYGARASITVDGVVWFTSAAPVPVLTGGAPTVDVTLVVQRVPAPP